MGKGSRMSTVEFDYIVIGAGTSGAALAARLGEAADKTTCVLEAGGQDSHPSIHVPSFVAAAIHNEKLNWNFETVPQAGMAGRKIGVPRGKLVGGSGSINGMVYFRGHPTDYDDWSDMGCEGWSYKEVLPYFTRTENNENHPESVFHGKGGPINVKLVENPNQLNYAFMDALADLNFPKCDDFNGPDPEGYGRRQGLIRDGRRESSAINMLRPAMERGNVELQVGAQVKRILIENDRATGVELTDGRIIRARHEVILAAGAVQSPQILMLSGIGPGAHLQEMGVEVLYDVKGVGENYHDHPASPIHFETSDSTSYGISPLAMPRNIIHFFQYLITKKGPLAGNVFESVAFLKTDPTLARPDVQFVFQPAKRLTTKIPFPVGHGYAISPVSLYPKSRGTVRLASPNTSDAPLIDPRILSEPEDILPLIRALKIARKALNNPAFDAYNGKEAIPGMAVDDDKAWDKYIRETGYTVHHPVGSCKMGDVAKDKMAVVDPQLRVRGIAGLRVADASIMPLLIGGNTNAPCVMIGEKCADFILGKPQLAAANLPETSVARYK